MLYLMKLTQCNKIKIEDEEDMLQENQTIAEKESAARNQLVEKEIQSAEKGQHNW